MFGHKQLLIDHLREENRWIRQHYDDLFWRAFKLGCFGYHYVEHRGLTYDIFKGLLDRIEAQKQDAAKRHELEGIIKDIMERRDKDALNELND